MASALFPTMQRFVADEWIRLDSERITPWAFFDSHFGVICTDFYGKPIACGGLEFEGSIRNRYWQRFIEPFLEDVTCRALSEARKLALDRNQDVVPVLEETTGLLISTARKAFARMADIDRRLRGKGHPETVTLHNTDRERRDMEAFINLHLANERRMVTPKRSLERYYRENQLLFLDAWVRGRDRRLDFCEGQTALSLPRRRRDWRVG